MSSVQRKAGHQNLVLKVVGDQKETTIFNASIVGPSIVIHLFGDWMCGRRSRQHVCNESFIPARDVHVDIEVVVG